MNLYLKWLALCLLIIFFVEKSDAQIIKGEAILGMNLTQVDGDEVYGFHKIGANVGAGVLIPFGKRGRWDASFEALFSQDGSFQPPQYDDSLSYEYELHLNYAQIPILVMFTDKEFISIGAGFSWGRLVGVKEWEHGQLVESTTLNSETYHKNDYCFLADIRIRIYKSLKFNLRYQYSLSKIRTREYSDLSGLTWTRDQFNNVISFRLIYVFGEKKSRAFYNQSGQ
jgi:hypothetical protein